MTVHIDLSKKSQAVTIVLEKRGLLKAPTCQVSFSCDISGSMSTNFSRGIVQETVNRFLAVANRFDDNGEMEVWAFNTSSVPLPPANAQHFGTYVNEVMLKNCRVSGGTRYAPVMKDVVEHYFYENVVQADAEEPKGLLGKLFGSKGSASKTERVRKTNPGDPVVNYFMTDGDNGDEAEAEAVLKECADNKYPIYWMLVGIGTDTDFKFIRRMADKYPNVGFVHIPELSSMTDETLFEELITTEFCEWTKR